VLGIYDFRYKTPRQSQISLTPARRDRLGPSKIPPGGGGPGFSGLNKLSDYNTIPYLRIRLIRKTLAPKHK
jgi:hypothetical protein